MDRETWQAAMDGWNERMANPATAGEVALAYMPIYQEALARTGDIASASFEDYCGMSVMLNDPQYGLDLMYAHYNIDVQQWSQISMYWVDKLTKDQELNTRFAHATQDLRDKLGSGQPPPPPGMGEKPQNVSAEDVVQAAGNISSLPPVAVGENCFVLWGDEQKYVGQVKEAGDGQCLIVFPDGNEYWIANDRISNE